MFSIVKIKDTLTAMLIDIINELFDEKLDFEFIYSNLEIPVKKEYGDLSYPVFSLSKKLRKNPSEIAQKICEELLKRMKSIESTNKMHYIKKIFFISGFLNFKFDTEKIIKNLLIEFINNKFEFKIEPYFNGFKMVIDYSAPNIAKPFGIGHLISTTLGESIKRMYSELGAKVIGINYIGDWGTQFGKVITAFKKWGDYKKLEKDGVYHLYELYVKFHQNEKDDPELIKEAKENFKKLEKFQGDVYKLWKKFREISLKEFEKYYKKLFVNIDLTEGESKYNNESIKKVKEIIEINGIVEESEGAKVVFLDDIYNEKIPPCIIETKNGTTIYAIRDIAALLDRWERFKFDRILYVTGITQYLHFKQVFGVIKKLNFPFKDRLFHIPFGTMRFKGEKMSTRHGNIIFLKDVYDRVYNEALKITKEKNISKNYEETAEKLTAGALTFSILKNSRIKDIDFDFDNVLSFEGDTSVYLQYTITRINSIIEKNKNDIKEYLNQEYINIEGKDVDNLFKTDFFNLFINRYSDLYLEIFNFEQVLLEASRVYEPYIISRYAIKIAQLFNSFYATEKVLVDDIIERNLKIIFILMIKDILKKSLNILNVPIPEKL